MNNPEQKTLDQAEADLALWRIKGLIGEGYRYSEICQILKREGYVTIRGREWTVHNLRILIYRLRHEVRSFYAISQRRVGFMPSTANQPSVG